MGNHPSAHQPLERATSYGGNVLRLSVCWIFFILGDGRWVVELMTLIAFVF